LAGESPSRSHFHQNPASGTGANLQLNTIRRPICTHRPNATRPRLFQLGGFRIAAVENHLDHHLVFDTDDDLYHPAADLKGLDVDVKNPLQLLHAAAGTRRF